MRKKEPLKIVKSESPTVEEIKSDIMPDNNEDLTEKANNPAPENFFNDDELPTEIKSTPTEIVDERAISNVKNDIIKTIDIGQPLTSTKTNKEMKIVIPWWKPWKGSGRMIVQPFKVKITTAGGIQITGSEDPRRIPNDVELHVVSIDPEIKGIAFGDVVHCAEDFVPTSLVLGGIMYYIPHWQDILIVNVNHTEMENIVKRTKAKYESK